MPSKYRITTDQGTYEVTVEDPYTPDPTMQDFTARAIARHSGALLPPQKQTDERGNEIGGMAPGLAKNFITNVVNNPIAQGAAHPSTLGDIATFFLPRAADVGGAIRGAKDVGSSLAEMASKVTLHPSALLDFKLNQPLEFLKHAVSIDAPPNPALPVAQDLGPTILRGAEQYARPNIPEYEPTTTYTAPSTRDTELLSKMGGRQPYSPSLAEGTAVQQAPNASPMRMADGSWGYRSLQSGEPLAEGTTAHVVTRGGKTFTTTVPGLADPAADLRTAQMYINSGMRATEAAAKASGGDVRRFSAIVSALSKARQ